jgi:hypothetical protein
MRTLPGDLPDVDAALLTPIVTAALGVDDARVIDWRREAFGHSLDEVYGNRQSIFRFAGTARHRTGEMPWAMVLKVVRAPSTPRDPSSPDNGDREPLAYRSGLLDRLAGIRAPRCYAAIERPLGGYWLWLESVAEHIGREWPLDRYMLAARHLGRFNATCQDVRTAQYPWLSRSPLREAVAACAPGVARLRGAMENPFISQAISPASADALIALIAKSDRWLDLLDRMPQTICHWDAHRANLLSRTTADGEVETVAIDWAAAGWGPIGSELSKLLSQTVNFFGLSVDALPALDVRLFEHYMTGLADGGWSGDERSVRLAYSAASAMRLIVRTSMAVDLALDARARAGFERAAGVPFATLAENFKRALPYYLSLVDEAERLAGTV